MDEDKYDLEHRKQIYLDLSTNSNISLEQLLQTLTNTAENDDLGIILYYFGSHPNIITITLHLLQHLNPNGSDETNALVQTVNNISVSQFMYNTELNSEIKEQIRQKELNNINVLQLLFQHGADINKSVTYNNRVITPYIFILFRPEIYALIIKIYTKTTFDMELSIRSPTMIEMNVYNLVEQYHPDVKYDENTVIEHFFDMTNSDRARVLLFFIHRINFIIKLMTHHNYRQLLDNNDDLDYFDVLLRLDDFNEEFLGHHLIIYAYLNNNINIIELLYDNNMFDFINLPEEYIYNIFHFAIDYPIYLIRYRGDMDHKEEYKIFEEYLTVYNNDEITIDLVNQIIVNSARNPQLINLITQSIISFIFWYIHENNLDEPSYILLYLYVIYNPYSDMAQMIFEMVDNLIPYIMVYSQDPYPIVSEYIQHHYEDINVIMSVIREIQTHPNFRNLLSTYQLSIVINNNNAFDIMDLFIDMPNILIDLLNKDHDLSYDVITGLLRRYIQHHELQGNGEYVEQLNKILYDFEDFDNEEYSI